MEKKMPEEQQVPRESSGGASAEPSCRVYVGNLSWRVRWQDLKDHMKQAGEVVRADVFEDFQGKSKGCGIVQYENVEGAQKAIKELTDSELFDRLIFVREDREDEHRLPGGRRGGYGSRSSFYLRGPRYYAGSLWRGRRGGAAYSPHGRLGNGWANRSRIDEEESRGHAAGYIAGGSGAAAAAGSSRRGTSSGRGGASSGLGYRRFGRGVYNGALRRNYFSYGGAAAGRGGRRPVGRGGFRGGGMRGGNFGGYSGYRGGRGGYAGGGGPPPAGGECAGRQIFVSNLPWRTSWQDLKDLFRECGDVVRADVMMMPDGRSKGVGTVLFASPEGADRAVQMFNDYMLDGRPILVRIDRVA